MTAELTSRPCPVCGLSEESQPFAEANVDSSQLDEFAFASRKMPEYMHWRLWLCGRCDLVYASPAPVMPLMEMELRYVVAFPLFLLKPPAIRKRRNVA